MTTLSEVSGSMFQKPPLDYSLSYLDIVDYNVKHSPSHPVFQYLNPDGSTRIINWKEAGAAFYNAARFIQAKCNAIQEANAGFVPFPISNRNSPAAVAHLLRVGDCGAILFSEDDATKAQAEKAFSIFYENEPNASPVVVISVPTYEDLFENTEISKNYPPLRKLGNVTHDSVCIIIHSSGSVSFPKPIKTTYRMLLQQGLETSKGEIDVCGEIFGGHGIPIYQQSVLSPDMVLKNAVQTNCTLIACVPSFIESWAQDKRKIDIMKKFKAILFGGGPLATAVGDMLVSEGINIVPLYGVTEAGGLSFLMPRKPPSEGWEWLRTALFADIVFVPSQITADENAYRLVVKAGPMKTLSVSNTTIDNIPAYDTNDLVIRHPTNPLLFKILGREDDQIMHSTGEKTNPTLIEGRLLKDPKIKSALVFGRSKFQPGVLIQPSPEYIFDPSDEVKLEEYRNLIWETVEEANKIAPQHSKIFKEFILVANPSKPFEYTAKGTPRRHAILKTYDPEIENIYQASENQTLSNVPAPTGWDLTEIQAFLHKILVSVLGHDVKDSDSIFLAGGDSLAAISIRNTIMHALRRSKLMSHSHIRVLPSDFVYMFPSVDALSAYIYGLLSFKSASQSLSANGNDVSQNEDPEDAMLPLVRAYKGPTVVKLRKGPTGEPPLIILHGAAGSISDFMSMSETYHSALWAIQVTEETPLTSIQALAEFYYGKIKGEQPAGPYRLAAYSGSCLVLVQLVQLFESKGDAVLQFVFLDHFPTIYLEGIDVANLDSPSSQKTMIDNACRSGVEGICNMVIESSSGADKDFRQAFAKDMMSALDGKSTIELAGLFANTASSLIKISLEFLLGGTFYSADEGHWSKEKVFHWLRKVKKTPTLYVAKEGLGAIFKSNDLGARMIYEDAKVVEMEGNHFTFLVNPELIHSLQDY
ncbi:hypothetical protein BDQ17DRAFT_1411496 [Cyathus striatus]|nr:hypothetical protein BDQ17DRAFT_1411496 [Cyathus striatus]